MAINKKLLAQLDTSVQQMIDACDSKVTPKLCAFRSTKGGRAKLATDIKDRVMNDGLSIKEAMLAIEKEFNPNRLD